MISGDRIRLNHIIQNENGLIYLLGKDSYSLQNNVLKSLEVVINGHFGNTVMLEGRCENINILSDYNLTYNIGYVIRALIELLKLSKDDGIELSSLRNIPVRLVFNDKDPHEGNCVGIGHFMSGEFVLFKDLIKCGEMRTSV